MVGKSKTNQDYKVYHFFILLFIKGTFNVCHLLVPLIRHLSEKEDPPVLRAAQILVCCVLLFDGMMGNMYQDNFEARYPLMVTKRGLFLDFFVSYFSVGVCCESEIREFLESPFICIHLILPFVTYTFNYLHFQQQILNAPTFNQSNSDNTYVVSFTKSMESVSIIKSRNNQILLKNRSMQAWRSSGHKIKREGKWFESVIFSLPDGLILLPGQELRIVPHNGEIKDKTDVIIPHYFFFGYDVCCSRRPIKTLFFNQEGNTIASCNEYLRKRTFKRRNPGEPACFAYLRSEYCDNSYDYYGYNAYSRNQYSFDSSDNTTDYSSDDSY